MAAGNSSQKRPTKKAATQDPSTSSSTTAPTANASSQASERQHSQPKPPDCVRGINDGEVTSESGPSTETWTEPTLLSIKQQKQFVQQQLKGLSSLMACSRIGVSLESVRLTLDTDPRFRRKCDAVSEALTENIRASLYSKALNGAIPAQALWFKEEAARKAASQQDLPLSSDEILAELDRLATTFRSLPHGNPGERGV